MNFRPVITDPSDFCRACRGRGSETEENGHGGWVTGPCRACGGTGRRAILLGEPKRTRKQT